MEQKTKKGFGSKIGFILAAVGSAVGLGNIWKFPYLVGKYGGGAFVLVYILAVLLIGTVVMIAEMYLGKRAENNVVGAYGKVNKRFKWLGMLCVIVPFLITTYYIVIGGWATEYSIKYLLESGFAQTAASSFLPEGATETSPIFLKFIADPVTPVFFTALFLVAALFIIAGGVEKGIEKASKILMPALFIMLLIVVIKALTLGEGVTAGLTFYLGKFDFNQLGWSGVIAAMGQAFFSLSLGMGVMLAYGAYTGKKTNLAKSALMIAGLDTFIALLVGFAIFPAIFALGNGEADVTAGTGLLFIVLPKIFAAMKGGAFFGFIFFSLVVFAAITSVISLIEVVSQYAITKHNMPRKKTAIVYGTAMGLIAIFVSLSVGGAVPYNMFKFDLLTYFDEMTNTVLMPLLGIVACLSVGWFMKKEDVFSELDKMGSNFKLKQVWYYMAKFVTPALVLVVFVMGVMGKWQTEGVDKNRNYGFVLLGAAVLIIATIVWNLVVDSQKHKEKQALKTIQELK